MGCFRKLSHLNWHCRYRTIKRDKQGISELRNAFSKQKECEIVEINVRSDDVHMIDLVLSKLSLS